MATSVAVDQDVELEQAVAALDERIGRQRLEVHEWEEKGKSASAFLAELRAQHTEICADAVLGKASQGAVNKVAAQIVDVENKVIGIEKIVSLKRSELSELQSALQPLHEQQSQRAQQRELVKEKERTDALLDEAERLLTVRDSAAKTFVEALITLRSTTYRNVKTRGAAFDGAQRLERMSNGMRP
jgi:hypothetical protein